MIVVLPRHFAFLTIAFLALGPGPLFGLPKRLILGVDGISYCDLKSLQEGLSCVDHNGHGIVYQAFHRNYFPVSRMVSTFPSTTDVAWTQIFRDSPLPGYQRTYYNLAANAIVAVNGITSSIEFEKQMTWRMRGGYRLAMSYLFPGRAFKYELREFPKAFLNSPSTADNFYAYLYSPDPAQHMGHDILRMLCALDRALEELRTVYRAREGRELEILLISDHGNDRGGPGKRVEIQTFLKHAGYRIAQSIQRPKDVVLPTVGIESWVEIHNVPDQTEALLNLLWKLEGVDILAAPDPGATNRFTVVGDRGERATIEWNPANNSFRYAVQTGDPLKYVPVLDTLARKHLLGPSGFASADDWMRETMADRYPLALERLVHSFTQLVLNPASILVSLKHGYVHAGWCLKKGSELVKSGGTHGALDDFSSTGILLSSFTPTQDTCAQRVALQFEGFPGRRDYRALETAVAWQNTVAGKPCLRVRSPQFAPLPSTAPVEVAIARLQAYPPPKVRRTDSSHSPEALQRFTLGYPITEAEMPPFERLYGWPTDLKLQPWRLYSAIASVRTAERVIPLFKACFHTDARGQPAAF